MFKKTNQEKRPEEVISLLNDWLDEEVIYRLSAAFEEYCADAQTGVSQDEAMDKVEPIADEVRQGIKLKVMEAYRKGLEDGRGEGQ